MHGRCYGQMDVAADIANGEAFKALAHRVPDRAHWYVTPLKRTHQTAVAIAQVLAGSGRAKPMTPIHEPAFLEQHFGEWQGKTYREIGAYAQTPDAHRFWMAPATHKPPGGESFEQVITRVGEGVVRLVGKHAGQDLVVVSHGGAIRAAVAHAMGLSPEAALAINIDTLSLTRIDHIASENPGHGFRLGLLNWPSP
jgi:alpha-ribazole phosphatase